MSARTIGERPMAEDIVGTWDVTLYQGNQVAYQYIYTCTSARTVRWFDANDQTETGVGTWTRSGNKVTFGWKDFGHHGIVDLCANDRRERRIGIGRCKLRQVYRRGDPRGEDRRGEGFDQAMVQRHKNGESRSPVRLSARTPNPTCCTGPRTASRSTPASSARGSRRSGVLRSIPLTGTRAAQLNRQSTARWVSGTSVPERSARTSRSRWTEP